nr:T-complex protein 1 subunit beta [Tanacetum cinerariifolium]
FATSHRSSLPLNLAISFMFLDIEDTGHVVSAIMFHHYQAISNKISSCGTSFSAQLTEEKGERARMASFVGAMAMADLVKTTLGPKGMDKILQSIGRGHSVSYEYHIDNPAAKVLIDISKVQDDEVGDGTTSVVVLAGELLREAANDNNFRLPPHGC